MTVGDSKFGNCVACSCVPGVSDVLAAIRITPPTAVVARDMACALNHAVDVGFGWTTSESCGDCDRSIGILRITVLFKNMSTLHVWIVPLTHGLMDNTGSDTKSNLMLCFKRLNDG